MPIPQRDIIKFMRKMSKAVVDVFKEAATFKTEFETDKPHPFDKIGELVLELPILEWEVLFVLLEETRDFFQENLWQRRWRKCEWYANFFR